MKDLRLSVATGGDSSSVSLTATFESPEDAISFHDEVAGICRSASKTQGNVITQGKFLSWAGK